MRAPHIIAALMTVVLSPAALAQKSSGHMDVEDVNVFPGSHLAVFHVAISRTDAICPQLIGTLRIKPRGGVTNVAAILQVPGGPDLTMETIEADDFTYRRRIGTDFCRIDIDVSEQQQRNDEWIPLPKDPPQRPNAIPDRAREIDDHPAVLSTESPSDRYARARAQAGGLRQGIVGLHVNSLWSDGMQDCFEAVGTYQINQGGVALLFTTGLGGDLNRFFIERVDVDADHSTLYLSRGSCRVGFTISASISRDGSWIPLPIAPLKSREGAERN